MNFTSKFIGTVAVKTHGGAWINAANAEVGRLVAGKNAKMIEITDGVLAAAFIGQYGPFAK